jgi:hypothetical protein
MSHAIEPPEAILPPAPADMIVVPDRYLRVEIDAERYEPACGRGPLERLLGADAGDLAEVFAQPCYRLAPGASCEIRVRAAGEHAESMPEGRLRLAVDRGRLERTEVELDGSQEMVAVGYTAPEETIRVSIRAFLDGHARGKAHLHLVPGP